MLQGIDIVPHAPTLVRGERYHPEVVAQLKRLGQRYEEVGGVVVVSPHFHDTDAFPVNPGDPLEEAADWEGFQGLRSVELRHWDGLPFLAELLQRSARRHGVPVALRKGPLDHGIWAPLRWMFPNLPMPILPVGLSDLGPRSHYRFGLALRDAVEMAPKPLAVLVSTNLTHRPDLIRWDGDEVLVEGRAVDEAILEGLRSGDWSRFDGLDERLLAQARPEGGRRLWALVRGLARGLVGDLWYYGGELGAFGMAVVHYETAERRAA